jgi:photosystem II stability/assembly factor-like uncharacterized protein
VPLDWAVVLGIDDVPHLYDVLVQDSLRTLVVGEFGVIVASADAGSTWTLRHRGVESLFAIASGPGRVLWCMGQDGALLRSFDEGVGWEKRDVGRRVTLLGMSMGEDGRGVLLGFGTVLLTDDGGQTWHRSPDLRLPGSWYQAVARTPHGAYLLSGAHGSIVRLVPEGRLP